MNLAELETGRELEEIAGFEYPDGNEIDDYVRLSEEKKEEISETVKTGLTIGSAIGTYTGVYACLEYIYLPSEVILGKLEETVQMYPLAESLGLIMFEISMISGASLGAAVGFLGAGVMMLPYQLYKNRQIDKNITHLVSLEEGSDPKPFYKR